MGLAIFSLFLVLYWLFAPSDVNGADCVVGSVMVKSIMRNHIKTCRECRCDRDRDWVCRLKEGSCKMASTKNSYCQMGQRDVEENECYKCSCNDENQYICDYKPTCQDENLFDGLPNQAPGHFPHVPTRPTTTIEPIPPINPPISVPSDDDNPPIHPDSVPVPDSESNPPIHPDSVPVPDSESNPPIDPDSSSSGDVSSSSGEVSTSSEETKKTTTTTTTTTTKKRIPVTTRPPKTTTSTKHTHFTKTPTRTKKYHVNFNTRTTSKPRTTTCRHIWFASGGYYQCG